MIRNLKEAIEIINIQREVEREEKRGAFTFRIIHLENKIAKILKELGLLDAR